MCTRVETPVIHGENEKIASRRQVSRTLILGLGNDLLADDAIGLRIVEELEKSGSLPHGVILARSMEMGLSLLDYVAGTDRLIIVDSVQTGHGKPGQVHVVDERDVATLPLASPHFLGVGEVLALGRALGMQMPGEVIVIAVEVTDPFTVGGGLSPEVRDALPLLVEQVRSCASLSPSP